MGAESDSHEVADTARRLRQVRDADLPARAGDVDDEIRRSIEAVSNLVDEAAHGVLGRELKRVAQEIRVLGTEMTAAREDAFGAVAHVLAAEASQLDALLRPADAGGTVSLPSPAPSAATTATSGTAVPTSPPSPAPRLDTTAAEAEKLHDRRPQEPKAKRRPINQVVASFPPKLQALARELLFERSSHAVQRHGHHLTREHQLARLQWRLDPAFADQWELHDDGSVTSERWNGKPHEVQTTAGHYTSPDAVAKPLIPILTAAGRTQHALDSYLNAKAEGETITALFLNTDTTGITAEDVYTLRAAGADTESGERLWLDARDGANDGFGAAPAAREYDMVTNGTRPGSLVVFAKGNTEHWKLITSYFTDDPDDLPYTEL